MVERIGNGGSLAREAVLAAIERNAKQGSAMRELAGEIAQGLPTSSSGVAGSVQGASFGDRLSQGLEAVDKEVRGVDELPSDLLTGKVEDFHEVAVQIKKAEFTFRFAMEVRNKLIDAYREVMRMSV